MAPSKNNSLAYLIPGIRSANYNEHDLIRDVCTFYELTEEEIRKRVRFAEIRIPRQVAMYMLSTMFPKRFSLKNIGTLLGPKGQPFDHATVLHSKKAVQNERETNTIFDQELKKLKMVIQSHMIDRQQEVN